MDARRRKRKKPVISSQKHVWGLPTEWNLPLSDWGDLPTGWGNLPDVKDGWGDLPEWGNDLPTWEELINQPPAKGQKKGKKQ
ncbi:MAG: hypothetical protein ISS66_05535 [Desulfobacteraceae bacterium]|nr:hypothetical protein [Desulfobacteraceae bacterium]